MIQFRRFVLLPIFAALIAGCLFSPDKKPPITKPPVVYPERLSPQQALSFMITAYQERDSVKSLEAYDAAYQGTSTDPSQPTPVVQFTRTDEVRHVGRLKRDPNIISVFLDLSPPTTWVRLPPDALDPPEWAVIQINTGRVEITDVGLGVTYESSSNPMTYTFNPTVDSMGDTTWTIIKWTEFAN